MFIENAHSYKPSAEIRKVISEVYAGLASKLLENKQYELSAEYFQMAENSGFISSEVYNDHGVALALASRSKEAVFKLAQALELDPKNLKTKDNYEKLTKKYSTNLKKVFKTAPHFDIEMSLLKDFYVAA